jgi:hypothetical protein
MKIIYLTLRLIAGRGVKKKLNLWESVRRHHITVCPNLWKTRHEQGMEWVYIREYEYSHTYEYLLGEYSMGQLLRRELAMLKKHIVTMVSSTHHYYPRERKKASGQVCQIVCRYILPLLASRRWLPVQDFACARRWWSKSQRVPPATGSAVAG